MGECGTTEVKRRRHTPQQIGGKLGDAGRLVAEGRRGIGVCKTLEVSEAIYHRVPGAPTYSFLASQKSTVWSRLTEAVGSVTLRL
jgi:hypothetical protein